MILNLLIGVLIAGLVVVTLNWFARTPPEKIVQSLKFSGIALLVLLALFLVFTGRVGWAIAALSGLAPWAIRLFRLHQVYRMLKQQFQFGRAKPGQNSTIATEFLRMSLDHDTGALSGTILKGAFAGKNLDDLDRAGIEALWRETAADEQSRKVLEAWLDRSRFPDWREKFGAAPGGGTDAPGGTPSAAMTREEAQAILGVAPGASAEEIKAAHKRLMRQFHPDQGGSNYLAAKINQAKDLLLNQ